MVSNLDFNSIFVDVLIAENSNNFCKEDCEARERTRQLMKDAGFTLFSDVVTRSDLFVNPKSDNAKHFLRSRKGAVLTTN